MWPSTPSTTPVVFANNTLKNVKLDVEKATSRVEISAIKGELQYTGDLNAASLLISHEGVTDKDGGYWYAQTRDTGADWVTKEGAANAHYYTGVAFECIDNATGLEADWLTVSYRTDGNTHWFMTVQPNESEEQRSATVTATFPDVDGYLVTEACKTKSVTVTQQGFTTTKTLGFYGGIGDKTISGAGADKLSLGYCVITVNGIYAESWGDNKNNEQELYGSVVIECRDGGAAAPIVDWLTVEYSKNADGKFNSTHLLATATENNTGAERRALVCCTYNAPEGYEFEGGAKSAFRQFFVIQPANSGVKVIDFWGGIGAEFNHNATAQQDWGLSYCVINVDVATATDWGGDSRNEQMLYGSAEFKCYDFTSGVRGEEIDWVTVEYKKDGNGKIIDTWWLADIQENTGAPRAAEIVCTWPE
ncbi:MAG: BACON domain-containing protein, partial [Tidjanibacter sp.]|nr:BACON domain-containing protein [Tidjanibacter sp.]